MPNTFVDGLEVYIALHPSFVLSISVINVMSILPPLEVKIGGRELPLNVPKSGEDVVDPSYTLTKSLPDSVLNSVNARVIETAPIGCISFLHDHEVP